MSEISFEGQIAIVTGSGAGLGRAYAMALAGRGASVVVNDYAPERADGVVTEIEAAGGRAVASYDSVADAEGALALVAKATDSFGGLHIVVNNAGTMRNALFEDLSTDDLESMLAVHVGGCWNVSHAAWPVLSEQHYGRILLVGSSGGMFSMRGIANYSAAKGGVYGLGRALAIEGRERGIHVNVLLPGAATTIAAGPPIPGYDTAFRRELREVIAPRRTAESVAPMVLYLVSRECDLTGETLSAVAGRFARVLVGITDGWFERDQDSVTPEQIAEHIDQICDTSTYTLPRTLFDEYEAMAHWVDVPPAG